ncbi:L,D-transpeptidase, partial [Shinella sp.]|uniref:L,D-transpeptidase n=1 Tax=Shinella sp. TaxID=1870904 RepID=UPI003F6FB16F
MSTFSPFDPSRRTFLSGAIASAAGVLAGCTTAREPLSKQVVAPPQVDASFTSMYRAIPEERFPLPAVDLSKIKPKFYRRLVDDPTGETPGTIVVDTRSFFLYLVRPGGKAMRYGVGLGRAGFEWSGRAQVLWKQAWPKWTPPDEMIARQPELTKWSAANGGMPPGLENPLGARALYIFEDDVDTLYRIHGSPEWWTIGKSVSSGCVRMINQD